MPLDRPIPAFYCCYLLRSTIRHSSLYVGSTPNPVRRLRQHNGVAKGGAARTSKDNLRPWEMAMIVTGFPSQIAALQFEWAWQNPHLTLHIPPSLRNTSPAERKASGRPKRPGYTLPSILANLLLLLRAPSFSRWPLELRIFAPDVHKSWLRLSSSSSEECPDSLRVVLDFPPEHHRPIAHESDFLLSSPEKASSPNSRNRNPTTSHGISALPLTYKLHKTHVEKSKAIIEFEQEGSCTICDQELGHDEGIYAVCPHPGCQSISHLTCLSKSFLEAESKGKNELSNIDEDQALVPLEGKCKDCGGTMLWVDIVKEVTLRMRGAKEVDRLLKEPKKKASKDPNPCKSKSRGASSVTTALSASDIDEEPDNDSAAEELDDLRENVLYNYDAEGLDVAGDDARFSMCDQDGDGKDEWLVISDFDDDAIRQRTSTLYASPDRQGHSLGKTLDPVIENNWDKVLVLD